ncbi:MAG: type IX secretion system protein PorQ [Saprospiraceae bacterium]
MQSTIKLTFIIIIVLSTYITTYAQIGGRYVFEFLGSPQSARLTSLGGSLITVADDDVSLAASNPALLSEKTDGQLSINHNFSIADISNGYLGYGRRLKKLGIDAHIGISYISFGDFVAADEYGNNEGTFSGGETALTLGASKKLNDRITLGANIKGIFGNMESYNSSGIGADIGILYTRPESEMIVAFLIKNIGYQLSAYGNNAGATPLDIQIGVSQKLQHLPFRFSITAHNLQKWGIRYDDPNQIEQQSLFGEEVTETSSFNKGIDNLFRHLIIGGEFLLGKTQGIKIRFAYNHLRRKELSLSNFRSLAGFSAGFGFKIKGINIDYGLGYYHLAGTANHLSVRTDINRIFRKF